MARHGIATIVASLLFLPLSSALEVETHWPDSYDVEWQTPSEDCRGSMPLGNGEVAVNAWIEKDGSLRLYLARSDSWDEYGRLLKIGRVRFRIHPVPEVSQEFRQRLRLRDATMVASWGGGKQWVTIQVWVDAHAPVVHVEITSAAPTTTTAILEPWRTEPMEIQHLEVSDVLSDREHPEGKRGKLIVRPDTVLENCPFGIGWYHHNTESIGPALTARIQGLADFSRVDPLLHRVFGAVVYADNGRTLSPRELQSIEGTSHRFKIWVSTLHPATPDQWLNSIVQLKNEYEAVPAEKHRELHCQWWKDFWERHYIVVSSSSPLPAVRMVPENEHRIRFGWDQAGGNRLSGELDRISLWDMPLSDLDIRALAQVGPRESMNVRWAVYTGFPKPGDILEGSDKISFDSGLTIEAWVKPEQLRPGGGRIVDKVTPGRDDGFLLDTYPGNSLRCIAGNHILQVKDALPAGKWYHVAVTMDPQSGELKLFLNGNVVAQKKIPVEDPAYVVSRGYCLQRFINACAGRGPYPIKFNGSLFTVAWPGAEGDADYRRWGPGYWWQNTRLPYYTMCAAGDFELMQPLFQMYAKDLVPLFKFRTRKYFNHGGLFIPECIYFWGDVFSETYGWIPFEERGEDKLQTSRWHKWEWVSGLELAWLMLDYYEYSRDEKFLKETALPVIDEVLTFFNEHYQVGSDGKLVMHPAQALETWWDCTNPMPEIAGLHAVLERLLSLPTGLTNQEFRNRWQTLRAKIPELPVREVNGVTMLAPAEKYATKRNIENTELYAVFPFRVVSFEKPNNALGIEALHHRLDRGHVGWRQDEIFMAYLGLAEEACEYVVARASEWNSESRFPAFWGPNFDWVPDQDHGSVLMIALQSMLLQKDGEKMFLLPAWPRDWSVRFRLHAPYRTVITGEYKDGQLVYLDVEPPERRKDVVLCLQQGSVSKGN
ncbi:DUF5703 domain-containing protein [Thermogutta sp.]|uniref:DUF5703 domain-containing protein n=1 Tax=Thermogutta sp. TaxID=1962930 RepID=UPI00321FDE69